MEKIPDGVSFERATLVEPLNTCLKAVVQCDPQPEDFVVVLGQGPIGLMFTMLVHRTGARVAATDTIAERLRTGVALRRGIRLGSAHGGCRRRSQEADRGPRRGSGDRGGLRSRDRGAGDGLLPARARESCFSRKLPPPSESKLSGADICVGERTLFGCYSASVDLQKESANLVFGGELPVEELISHRLPLVKIRSGFDLALHPGPKSLKIIVQPQRWS